LIEAVDLSKSYDEITALDNLNFTVNSNEVTGFIGPNGAGKSTTLRILSSYLQPSSGLATVAGFDCVKQGMEVKRRIGYLPENVPLYREMRVSEYLKYRGQLKGLFGKQLKKRYQYVLERCWLKDVEKFLIQNLSKGYRQRLGLADALIHHPLILILDEPMVGLDPVQIKETRELIRSLGTDHTILLSSHILTEIESLCKNILIIEKGKIIAQGSTENFHKQFSGFEMLSVKILSTSTDDVYMALSSLEAVSNVEILSQKRELAEFLLKVEPGLIVRERIFDLVVKSEWKLLEMKRQISSLEDLYLKITSKDEVDKDIKPNDTEEQA